MKRKQPWRISCKLSTSFIYFLSLCIDGGVEARFLSRNNANSRPRFHDGNVAKMLNCFYGHKGSEDIFCWAVKSAFLKTRSPYQFQNSDISSLITNGGVCHSVHRGGGVYPLPLEADLHGTDISWELPHRSVRILLECILVTHILT